MAQELPTVGESCNPDDGIRELHGCFRTSGREKDSGVWTVRERDTSIVLFQDFSARISMAPADARFLARKLYRLARRIEKRIGRAGE